MVRFHNMPHGLSTVNRFQAEYLMLTETDSGRPEFGASVNQAKRIMHTAQTHEP